MPRLSTIVIDGTAYRWRDIQRLRREQLAAWESERKAAQADLLGDLPDMRRSRRESTPEGRYYSTMQASLLPLLNDTNP